jgi:7-carboxy-7-deazaguanine synthase
MTYLVKEAFFTLQGEGANTGRPAVFCRFTGCNLWTGREAQRATAVCRFCDTDFVGTDGDGGGRFATPDALADHLIDRWPSGRRSDGNDGDDDDDRPAGEPFLVCTGGEPLLQLDEPLLGALHDRGFRIAIETNGTLAAPAAIDWICVSPKAGADLVQDSGDELKLIHPQPGADPSAFVDLAFDQFFLQPMDGPDRDHNTRLTVEYCLAHPQWRLSLQTHKYLGIR